MTKNVMWSDAERTYLAENFGKVPTKEIAAYLNRKATQVASYANYYGLHITTLRGVDGKGRTHAINEDIFCTWTPAMAYGLGLIVSDGCVQPRGFTITSKDIELLENAKRALEIHAPIQEIKNRGCYVIQVGSVKLRADLIALGVLPAKSLIATLPPVPDDMFFHFLRGYFDGDGTVYSKNGKSIMMSISSGSETILTQISCVISRLLGIGERNLAYSYGDPYDDEPTDFSLTYCGPAASKIGTCMYENSDGLYLSRKRTKFTLYDETPHLYKGNPTYDKVFVSEEDKRAKLRDYFREYMRAYRAKKRSITS